MNISNAIVTLNEKPKVQDLYHKLCMETDKVKKPKKPLFQVINDNNLNPTFEKGGLFKIDQKNSHNFKSYKSTKKNKNTKDKILSKIKKISAKEGLNIKRRFNGDTKKFSEDLQHCKYLLDYLDLESMKFLGNGADSGVFVVDLHKGKSLSKRRMVLKVIDLEQISEHRSQKFCEESNLHAKIRCKNVVKLYGVYDIPEGNKVMLLEHGLYGDLGNFYNKLTRKNVTQSLIAFTCLHILKGLKYIHSIKVAHFDIKPMNIIVHDDVSIKITDFSISFDYSEYDPAGYIRLNKQGTSIYMAPEVLQKQLCLVEDLQKIDIYSFGVSVYLLMFNKLPYGMNNGDIKNKQMIEFKLMNNELKIPEADFKNDIHVNFFKRVLDKNIENRYTIEEALNDPWMKCAEELFLHKQKEGDIEKFLIALTTDDVRLYNEKVNERRLLMTSK